MKRVIGGISGENGVIDWLGGDMRLNRSVFSVSFFFLGGEKRIFEWRTSPPFWGKAILLLRSR